MLAYYAMGPTIASHAITKAALTGAQPIESGADRNVWDGEFGKQVEARLRELYDRTMRILEENRHEVLAVAHALETRKTITGEDVEAIIEGRQGALLDGRPYHDSRFAEELERYHAAASEAHAEHGDVREQVPVPIPPAPVDLLDDMAGNGHRGRDQVRVGPQDEPTASS